MTTSRVSMGFSWWKSVSDTVPDVFGHFPFGDGESRPYLQRATRGLRGCCNFYNRDDYALDAWLFNNALKPDSLSEPFGYDTGEGKFYHEVSGERKWIDPVADERARWCVFSYVTRSPSLAVGQVPLLFYMNDTAKGMCVNLKNEYGYGSTHYFHSAEFRSNMIHQYKLWMEILKNMKK